MSQKNKKGSVPANSGKAPSFQFYPKDWLADYRLKIVSKRAKGVWIDLICLSCDMPTPGVFRDENGAISRQVLVHLLSGNRRENYAGFDELVDKNIIKQEDDGTFYVKRIKRDMELRKIRKECGKLGGNPFLVGNLDKQKPNLDNQNNNQNPTPSPSSSTSPSAYTLQQVIDNAIPIGISEEKATAFYHQYNAQGWVRANGQPITDLQSQLINWRNNQYKFDKIERGKNGSGKTRTSSGRTDKNYIR